MWAVGAFVGSWARGKKLFGKTKTTNRRPIVDRWDVADAEQIQFVPWKVNEDDEEADGEFMAAAKLSDEEARDQLREGEFDMGAKRSPEDSGLRKRTCGSMVILRDAMVARLPWRESQVRTIAKNVVDEYSKR